MKNIPAKKSLGQNFLKSKVALVKMLEAGEVNNQDIVLEVGPGKGALTKKLLEKAGRVIAIEKDDRLIELLKEKFQTEVKIGKLEIIHGDILDFSPSQYKLESNKYKIIANIPYYITGQFLRKFLESDNQPNKIVIMVQKEIADRIIAKDNKENLLSLSVKAYGEPKKIMRVDKENFSPAPKVDSAILLINKISKKIFSQEGVSEQKFFDILHAGFAHKRKMLLGNLKVWLKKNNRREDLEAMFNEINIASTIRPEDLKIDYWFKLAKKLFRTDPHQI